MASRLPSSHAEPRGRPVFLHGMWRSASTFVWSRFREHPQALCFYEPLHQRLARLTHDGIRRETPDPADDSHHPEIEPYFAEYAALIRKSGVRRYRRRFAFDRFVLAPAGRDAPLERYVSILTARAERRGQQAVLGFNRAGLRVGWLASRFSAVTVHLDRDPLALWSSYMRFGRRGKLGFFRYWLRILEKNARHPLLAPLAPRLHLRRRFGRSLRAARVRELVAATAPHELYLLVYYFWVLHALHALSFCDAVIDVDLADDTGYPAAVASRLAESTGLRVDLSELKPRPTPRPDFDRDDVEERVHAILPTASAHPEYFDPHALRRGLRALHPDKRARIERALV